MRARVAALMAAVTLTALFVQAGIQSAAAESEAGAVSVELDRRAITVGIGDRIGVVSTVHNDQGPALTGLVAHLNLLSSDPSLYVDPEDWSSDRTQILGPLRSGQSARVTWEIQAVNSGLLLTYVVVTTPDGADAVVSDPLRLTVVGRRPIDTGNVVPLALGMPAVVLALLGLTEVRRRRR